MTLVEVVKAMEAAAMSQPAVQTIVENDVFKLNSCPDARYGVFAFVQGQHSGSVDSDLMTYQFSLFYVDRLTHDRSNQIEVQSAGVSVLSNILRVLSEAGIVAGDYSFQPFNQRFSDECAGVYCTVGLSVLRDSSCGETYDAAQKTVI